MKIFSLSGTKTKKESDAAFQEKTAKRVVSKFSEGSVHVNAGHFTTEKSKDNCRKKVQELKF